MATLLGSLFLSACSVFGVRSGTEEPHYSVVERLDGVEIRHYAARVAAETTVPGDATAARGEGFRRLAGYIFGGNRGRTRIEMTAPVAQAGEPPGERIAMTAPVGQEGSLSFALPRARRPDHPVAAPAPDGGEWAGAGQLLFLTDRFAACPPRSTFWWPCVPASPGSTPWSS